MSVPTMIAYSASFLITSSTMNYINRSIKSSLPEIDMEALDNASPFLANIASNASTVYSLASLGLTIYTGHYAASQAVNVVNGIEILANMETAELVANMAPYVPGYQAVADNLSIVANGYQSMGNLVPLYGDGYSLSNIFPVANINLFHAFPGINFITETLTGISNIVSEGYSFMQALPSILDGGESIIDGLYGIETASSWFDIF